MQQLVNRIHDRCCQAWDATWPLRRPLVSRVEYNFKMWSSQALGAQSVTTIATSEGLNTVYEELIALREEIEGLEDKVDRARHRVPKWDRLVFIHIPKTGGTALNAFAKSHFAPHDVTILANERNLKPEMLETKYFAGHVPAGVLDRLPHPVLTMTVLREPVSRALSEFSFRRGEKPHPDTPADELAAYHEAQAWTLAEYASLGESNAATTMLGGRGGSDEERLARARERLASLDVVGVHERLWEAAVMLCLEMGWSYPGEIAPANVTKDRIRQEDVDPDIIQAIRKRDHLDCELYAFADNLSQERWRRAVSSMVNRLCD